MSSPLRQVCKVWVHNWVAVATVTFPDLSASETKEDGSVLDARLPPGTRLVRWNPAIFSLMVPHLVAALSCNDKQSNRLLDRLLVVLLPEKCKINI